MTTNYETISPLDQKSKMDNSYKNESASTAGGSVKKNRHILARYPKGVFFCLGNEFTERFSFYGMRAVLTFYLMAHHSLDESSAKLIFHLFVSIAYFTPLLGSILADGFLGRFKVILYFSVLYCIGHVLLTLGSLPIGNLKAILTIVDFAGLFTIAVSTGGIKPCVSAFAADQFPADMQQERKQFFSFFYFSINVGALLSQIVTPLFRGRVSCLGEQTCFPLAFGVPSIFMVLALVIFLCGTPFYKRNETRDNVIWEVGKCTAYAAKRKLSGKSAGVEHWLDGALPKYSAALINDIKGVLAILLLYLPVIFFWALFDQQGSTWVLQAAKMDCRLGYLTMLPDQMSLLNPLLIILLIPLFEFCVYPALATKGLLTRPLQRMGVGGFLAASSFFVAGFIQLRIDNDAIRPPIESQIRVTSLMPFGSGCSLFIGETEFKDQLVSKDVELGLLNQTFIGNCNFKRNLSFSDTSNDSDVSHKNGLIITTWPDAQSWTELFYTVEKSKGGNSTAFVLVHPSFLEWTDNSTLEVWNGRNFVDSYYIDSKNGTVIVQLRPPIIGSNVFRFYLTFCGIGGCRNVTMNHVVSKTGAVDLYVVMENSSYSEFNLIHPNEVNIFWQMPQFVLITVGELLFSISGLEFSYSQASPSMKSVLQAIWLLTVAAGNVLDMIISGTHLFLPATEFFVYASLMVVVISIFTFLAHRYKNVDRDNQDDSVFARSSPSVDSSIPINNLQFRRSKDHDV